jgi:hypothetical protein
MLKLLILFLISLASHALEYNDTIGEINVIKHYKKNVLVLDRGLEDGIDKFDHIKLTNQNGYIARAICVKVSMLLSYWKVYRVVNPELLSYDESYVLRSMKQSSLPPHIKKYVQQKKDEGVFYLGTDDTEKMITDRDLGKVVRLQQDRIVKFDLANDVLKDKVLEEDDKKIEEFVERNFNSKQLSEDLDKYRITFFTSPVSWQSQNDQKSINYGFNIENIGRKYEFSLNYERNESKAIDQFTEDEVSFNSTDARLNFGIKRLTDDLSYFMYTAYQQARQGQIDAPVKAIQTGLLGLRFHFFPIDAKTTFDISYITTVDYLETQIQEEDYDSFDNFLGFKNTTLKEKNARHTMNITFRNEFSEFFNISSELRYAPLINLDEQRIIWRDNKTNWRTSLNYRFSEKLTGSYEFTYIDDLRQETDLNLDRINKINVFNISYQVEI